MSSRPLTLAYLGFAFLGAAVLGAFDAIQPGGSLVLVAPHDPLPLLQQLSQRAGGRVRVTYLERGPQAWRLQLTR